MRTTTKLLTSSFLLLALTACGSEPTLDSTSDAALESSIQEVKSSLPAEERSEFEEALTIVMQEGMNLLEIVEENKDFDPVRSRRRLDGLTVSEVYALADSIEAVRQAELDAREREEMLADIRRLEAKKKRAEEEPLSFDDFVIEEARFYMNEDRWHERPLIELTVTNNLDVAVSRGIFNGILKSPGRSVPWIEDKFRYSIPGGIEPGETTTWKIEPMRPTEWWYTDTPSDAVLTVEVEGLYGPSGRKLEETKWHPGSQALLDDLKKRYAEGSED